MKPSEREDLVSVLRAVHQALRDLEQETRTVRGVPPSIGSNRVEMVVSRLEDLINAFERGI